MERCLKDVLPTAGDQSGPLGIEWLESIRQCFGVTDRDRQPQQAAGRRSQSSWMIGMDRSRTETHRGCAAAFCSSHDGTEIARILKPLCIEVDSILSAGKC